jgi:hypothetical protein
MASAKSIGWAIYAAGFVIWLFGYVSTGHAAAFDWEQATPRWISSFVPNLEKFHRRALRHELESPTPGISLGVDAAL